MNKVCHVRVTVIELLSFQPTKGTLEVHVGVNDYGLHLINKENKTLFQTYPLKGLDWTHKIDKPYLDIRAKQYGQSFVLQTPQVCVCVCMCH